MNNKAVSPVIGVILMVAITVILAAAIGSSVFGQGTAQSAPQANLDVTAVNPYTPAGTAAEKVAVIKIQHLGGEPINFGDVTVTKVLASVNGTSSVTIDATGLSTLNVGDIKPLELKSGGAAVPTARSGSIVNIKAIDVKTNQLILDKDVRY